MNDNKNILLKEMPAWIPRILKGLAFMIVPIPVLFFIFILIASMGGGFLSDVQGQDYGPVAIVVVGIIYLFFFVAGIGQIMDKNILGRKAIMVPLIVLLVLTCLLFLPALR